MNEEIYEEHDHEECDCCQSGTCGIPAFDPDDEFVHISGQDFINNTQGFQFHD